MTPADFIRAARVPDGLADQAFGLWTIERDILVGHERAFRLGRRDYTRLRCVTDHSMHLGSGEIVMEDSPQELRKHLPIWRIAHGRVLKTGLGLGCVVRGLLAKPGVTHIDVVEIDAGILRVIGREFSENPRVTLHHADALEWMPPSPAWDFAWHDIWCPGNDGLELLHAELIARFQPYCGRQGAWAFPAFLHRLAPGMMLGGQTRRRTAPAARALLEVIAP